MPDDVQTESSGRRDSWRATLTPDQREGARVVERLLQINMAVLASLGTLVLSLGQGMVIMPLFVMTSAAASVYLVDWTGKIRLSRNLANTIAILAVIYAVYDFFGNDSENQILAIANLLGYLQVVLFYQRKNYRVYGHLAVLSLLQVVVASALSLGFEFGLLMVLYMFTAISGLWLMFVHRELFGRDDPLATFPENDPRGHSQPAEGFAARLHRWPLARQQARFAPCLGADAARRMVGRGMVQQVVKLGLGTLLLTAIVFYSMPRWQKSVWQGHRGDMAETGFDEQIEFGKHREITESDAIAFRVTFYDDANRPKQVGSEPYFRGRVLSRYEFRKDHGRGTGTWVASYDPWLNLQRLPAPATQHGLLRQEVVLSPQHKPVLFAAFPVYATQNMPGDVLLDWHSWQLMRFTADGSMPYEQYRYEVATDAFADNHARGMLTEQQSLIDWGPLESFQFLLSDEHEVRPRSDEEPFRPSRSEERLALERERLSGLITKAQEVVNEAGTDPNDKWAVAQVLEEHFLTDPRYSYSLDRLDREDTSLDPNEDFVVNNPVGHCEYYASALTLMLRSQGIHARLVQGYKGGEYNAVGHYYLVRQLHAHAWVEAYFSAADLAGTAEGERVQRAKAQGAWIRLDPTPGREFDSLAASNAGLLGLVQQWKDYVQLLWDDRVVGLNSERQQEMIYEPLQSLSQTILSPDSWRAGFNRTISSLGLDPQGFVEGRWFNWRAGLLAMAISLMVVGIWRMLRKPVRQMREFIAGRATAQRLRIQRRVPFYEHTEALLARHGWRRGLGQTQREFMQVTSQAVALKLPGLEWQGTLDRIVDAYYRVRFGGVHLEEREVHDLETALGRLDAALKQRRRTT